MPPVSSGDHLAHNHTFDHRKLTGDLRRSNGEAQVVTLPPLDKQSYRKAPGRKEQRSTGSAVLRSISRSVDRRARMFNERPNDAERKKNVTGQRGRRAKRAIKLENKSHLLRGDHLLRRLDRRNAPSIDWRRTERAR